MTPYSSLLTQAQCKLKTDIFLPQKKKKQKPNALDKQQSPILGLKYLRLLQGGPSVRQCVI